MPRKPNPPPVPTFEPEVHDKVIEAMVKDAEKHIAFYKARLKAAKAELKRRAKKREGQVDD